MADQHHDNTPAMANQISADIPDIAESIDHHKAAISNFCQEWSDTNASIIYPYIMKDDDLDTIINLEESDDEDTIRFDCAGSEVFKIDTGGSYVDTINELTAANGVTIDSLSIKDGALNSANCVDSDCYVDGSIDGEHLADNCLIPSKVEAELLPIVTQPANEDSSLEESQSGATWTTKWRFAFHTPSTGGVNLRFRARMKHSNGSDYAQARLYINSAAGSTAQTTETSYTWIETAYAYSNLSASTWYEAQLQIRSSGGATTAYLDGFAVYWN